MGDDVKSLAKISLNKFHRPSQSSRCRRLSSWLVRHKENPFHKSRLTTPSRFFVLCMFVNGFWEDLLQSQGTPKYNVGFI